MHLLYARFFTRAIRDIGLVDFGEPFTRLFNQGIIISGKSKMSKSKGNVVNPDEYVAELGADAVRAYLMFVAPWEQGGEWNDSGISGISRWFNRLWPLVLSEYKQSEPVDQGQAENELTRVTHQTIKRVTEDLEKMRFNTMVAALMEFTNYLAKVKEAGVVANASWEESIKTMLLLLAPTAPHMAEELWQRKGHEYSIHNQKWLRWDEALAKDEQITLVIQVNGKVRDKLVVSASISEDEARIMAGEPPKVQSYLEGRDILNIIYVPGKLVNFVVK
jgi:leucyl-tRNA synthetase